MVLLQLLNLPSCFLSLLQKIFACVTSNFARKIGTVSSNLSRSGMDADYWDLEKCSLFEIETSLVLELAE